MSTTPLLVTGASGQLGRRVLELLLARGAGPIIATTRNPDSLKEFAARGVEVRRADFEDEAGLAQAFRGAGRALLISTDALDRPGRRLAQHQTAIRALKAAGVRHIVYTSLPNPGPNSPVTIAPDHRQTEEAIQASGLDYTFLRNNLYTDLMLHTLPGAIASGQIIDARGKGATAFVTREDCAQAATAALAEASSGRNTLDVTGPESLTSDQVAAIVSEVVGRKIVHVSVPAEALIRGMQEHGLPKVAAELYASFDVAIEKGDLATVTDTVKRLSGRTPQTVREFLTAHKATLTKA
ncbi:SDR family oxidoreductase [Hyalangium versicolor]|uniref:SDR family oxidoreductase n=1 Tax=Hyalangium versicolor TaxID=2861190 RepID=UPI001CCF214D|nr:SDR family oxidoreductase [Hyalangium versicolor]